MKLKDIRYIGMTGHFTAGALHINDNRDKFALDLEEVFVDKMLVDEKRGDIFSENISWERGEIKLLSGGGGKELSSILNIRKVHGRDTRLTAKFGKREMTSYIRDLQFERLDKRPGETLQVDGLKIEGEALKLTQEGSLLEIARYHFIDRQPSGISGFLYDKTASNGNTRISVPSIRFTPFLETYISGRPRIQDVVAENPRIEADLAGTRSGATDIPEMDINSITLNRPDVNYRKKTGDQTFSLQWNGKNTPGALIVTGLVNRKDGISSLDLQNVDLNLSGFSLLTMAGKKFNTGNGNLSALVRDIRLREQEDGTDWQATVTELRAKDILMDSVGKKKNQLHIGELLLHELALNTASIANLENLTRANAKFRMHGFNGQLSNANSVLNWYQLMVSRPDNSFSLDSMRWEPTLSMDSFMAKQELQIDYIKLNTGSIRMLNADIESFIRDNSITGDRMEISNPVLSITRDTRLRFDSGKIKLLPVNQLRKITSTVDIERVNVKNGTVYYSEITANGEIATIPITNLDLDLSKVKNSDFNTGDSLVADVTGNIFESARIYLQLRESYIDSLSGFRLDVQFGPTSIGILNPAFIPLGAMYIRSGELDTAMLTVIANEYLAYGEMNMKYRDLKLQLLKEPGSLDRKNTRGLLTFIANTFVIKNKNSKKPGVVFVIRNRERSIFNYLVKIATKGFQTSIGIGSNRKLTKQYERELKKRELPGIWLEDRK